jgi:lysophospholipase L1-like esterase
MPTFGDLIHARYKVPVGITAVSVGATSVRQWLPAGTRVTVPPTRLSGLVPAGPGQWEASGELFDRLATRLLQLGPYGCRAVLWHQGESDANQALVGRTLPGGQYRDSLEQIIRKSRERAGWEVPWFVAQASYHSPRDPGSPDIRAAQEALWVDGIALEGPDTDALTGDLRDNGGRGVHFSAKGLQVHGERWAEKVGAHLDKVLAKP